jgi:glycine cleavage system T protein (aminomethyltransferase)
MPELIPSPLADFHASRGATLGEYHGAIVPARFSDPLAEHRAVRTASGILDLSFRSKFAVKGRDAVKFLHRIVSNDVKALQPGQGAYATLLNAQGHILADMRIYLAADRLLVDTDADLRPKLMAALGRYIIGDQVELEPLDLGAVGFEGPQSRGLLEKTLHVELPALSEYGHFAENFAGFPIRVVRASITGEEGFEVWTGTKGMAGLWGAACGQAPTYGTLPCGTEAVELLRIEAGSPRYGSELAEDTLPLEAGLLNALSFTKGCYVGQEIVERARSRGHVNWKLVGLAVASAPPPAPGEKLAASGKEIGEVTSACFSPSLGKTIALAYVRREFSEPGAALALLSGARAQVVSLPFYRRTVPASAS